MRNLVILLFILLLPGPLLHAQQENNELYEGNKEYKKGNYTGAGNHYKEAINKKRNNTKAHYNLGNTYYREHKFEEAGHEYDVVLNSTNNRDTISLVYHNIGNSYLKQKKYQEAVNAYKNSLKLNPRDEDTRYNLAYALKKLQEQQKKGGGQNKQQQGGGQNEKKQNGNQGEKKEKAQQQESQGISKEEAQRMLEALKNAERKIQEDKKEKNKNSKKTEVDKDW